jgi:uncharacterized membrane protein (DUF4010 family)
VNWLQHLLGAQASLVTGWLAALGSGALIGLERERSKGRGPSREPAGLRTFTLAALCGALTRGLEQPGLVAVGALAVTLLAALAYSRRRGSDPGLTTAIALFLTFLIGALCVEAPLLGAPAAIITTALLAARTRLHRFATQLLHEDELHDGLLLGALALVVLPLMPKEPLPWLGGMKASALMGLMLLLLLLQALGHVALRLAGPSAGLALSGLLGGLVSSTATIASLGARARQHPEQPALQTACAAGAIMSTAATWLLSLLMLAALAPAAAARFWPLALTGGASAGLIAWRLLARTPKGATPQDAVPAPLAQAPRGPLRVREALLIAALLSSVSLAVNWALQRFGSSGLYGAVGLAALADAHAPVASLAALQASAQIGLDALMRGVLLALACNSVTRSLTALLSGGALFARRVLTALLLSLGLAILVMLALP